MAKRFSEDYEGWVRALKVYLAFRILVRHAIRRETTTYGALGARIHTSHLHIWYYLGPIREYCEANGLPRLVVLVSYQHSGDPGHHYTYPSTSIPADREAV